MDRHMDKVDDLSERAKDQTIPKIPMNLAIAVFAILVVSGILVGAVIPELIEGTEGTEEIEITDDIMNALISSTIPQTMIGTTTYTNIPVPTAFQVLFLEGDPSVDHNNMDEPIGEMMDYMTREFRDYSLTVSPGAGLPQDAVEYRTGNGTGTPDAAVVREVPVGLGEDEGTVVFELRIWGVTVE